MLARVSIGLLTGAGYAAPMLALLLLSLSACKKETPAAPEAPKKEEAAAKPAEAGDIPAPEDVAAPPADATKTASGLAYKVLTPGNGPANPMKQDSVEVNYTGWTTDGKMFDSSVKRGKPAKFALKAVIPGWTEGLQLMVVGEKARFWIPEELAYKGKPGKPAGMLVFDVELLGIKEGPKPIPAPDDVAAAPSDAKKTKSGLAYKVLTKGTGKAHPKADSKVVVDYTGWMTNGEMFDSSVVRGKPATFGLNQVIPGWTEGVQLMVVGEETRFWIPADMAYGTTAKRPGAPAGDLTFDVKLIEIKEPSADEGPRNLQKRPPGKAMPPGQPRPLKKPEGK